MILGGHGFIGTNLAAHLTKQGCSVVTVDRERPILSSSDHLTTIVSEISLCGDLPELIDRADIVYDFLGFTQHSVGFKDPLRDAKDNLLAHIELISALRDFPGKKVVYLGSTSQFGKVPSGQVEEMTNLNPSDPQGINKSATESYYRIYTQAYGFSAISVRVPNCFGPYQRTTGKDPGLLGYFFRQVLDDRPIVAYGSMKRMKNIVFVEDLCEILTNLEFGTKASLSLVNVPGQRVTIEQIVNSMRLAGFQVRCEVKEFPQRLATIDSGDFEISSTRLRSMGIQNEPTPIDRSFKQTLEFLSHSEHCFGGRTAVKPDSETKENFSANE